MIEIGGKPILWHIMKLYSHFGFNDFIICAGYKQEVIKEWFANYFLHNSDVTFRFSEGKNQIQVHDQHCEPWNVTVVDTGLSTMTGGRVKRVRKFLGDEPFFLTYGDGVSDVDIQATLHFHRQNQKLVTISCYSPGQRFGMLDIREDGQIEEFREKIQSDGNMINIGFMVCNPAFIDHIAGDETVLEKEPLANIAKEGQLMAYKHYGFWQCMDTLREKQKLEELWESGSAPWNVWGD